MSKLIFDIAKSFDTVVWDWNGTLLDDLKIVREAEAEHFPLYGVAPPDAERRAKAFCFPIQRYYENVGFDFSNRDFSTINAHFMEIYYRRLDSAALYEGAAELLRDLATAKKRQFVLSAAPQKHLELILTRYGLRDFFEDVYGLPHSDADSKIQRGRELITQHKFEPAKTIMIGDTEHDLEVAKALGFQALLLGDGHGSIAKMAALHHLVLERR